MFPPVTAQLGMVLLFVLGPSARLACFGLVGMASWSLVGMVSWTPVFPWWIVSDRVIFHPSFQHTKKINFYLGKVGGAD